MVRVKSVPDPLPLNLEGTPDSKLTTWYMRSLGELLGFCWYQANQILILSLALQVMLTLSPRDADKDGDWVIWMSHIMPLIGNIHLIFLLSHDRNDFSDVPVALITKQKTNFHSCHSLPGIQNSRNNKSCKGALMSVLCCVADWILDRVWAFYYEYVSEVRWTQMQGCFMLVT